jgi:hypothetical protein
MGSLHQQLRFLCLYKPGKPERPPTQREMAEMGMLIGEAMTDGWLIATAGCLPSAGGARLRLEDGKFTVIDGPFAETKELVGGFAIIQASSKQVGDSAEVNSAASTILCWNPITE